MLFAVETTASASVNPAPESFVRRLAMKFRRFTDAQTAARDASLSATKGVLKCNARVVPEDAEAEHELSRMKFWRSCFEKALDLRAAQFEKAKAKALEFPCAETLAAVTVTKTKWETNPTHDEVLRLVIAEARAEWAQRERAR